MPVRTLPGQMGAGYPLLAFPEVPKVEVQLQPSGREAARQREASSAPAAAAIANAVSNALGRRVRDLPLYPERIRGAIG